MTEIVLSDKQQKIVDFRDGALLVKASAGSGKTLSSAVSSINNGSADASKFVLDLTIL